MIAKAKARAGSVRQSLGLTTHRAHEPTDARAGGAVISVPDLGMALNDDLGTPKPPLAIGKSGDTVNVSLREFGALPPEPPQLMELASMTDDEDDELPPPGCRCRLAPIASGCRAAAAQRRPRGTLAAIEAPQSRGDAAARRPRAASAALRAAEARAAERLGAGVRAWVARLRRERAERAADGARRGWTTAQIAAAEQARQFDERKKRQELLAAARQRKKDAAAREQARAFLAKQRAPGSLEEQMIIERRRRRPADDADDAPVGGGGAGGGGSGWPSWTFENVTFTSLIAPLALEAFLDLDESRSSRSSSPDVRG